MATMILKSLVAIGSLLCLSCQSTGRTREALVGEWACGPYSMSGDGFEVAVTSTSTYAADGAYQNESALHVKTGSGKSVRTRDRVFGRWTFDGSIIEVHFNRSQFLWSDDPTYTVEMGQQDADAQLRLKAWSKAKVLALGKTLVTVPVESMYENAEVEVTCVRS